MFVFVLDFFVLKTRVIVKPQTWRVMLFLLVMTAIFDQFLTGLPIVNYTESNTSGIKLFYAPVEDFSYTIAVVILVGSAIAYGERKNWL